MADRLLEIEGRRLTLVDQEAPAWPGARISRGELLAYYRGVADMLLPFLRQRPSSAVRRQDGGLDAWTFDRGPGPGLPTWISRCAVRDETPGSGPTERVVVDGPAALAALVNAGCLSFHPWSSCCQALDRPDQLLLDVDPTDIAFREVRNAALLVRDLLARYGIESWVKTSGGRGVHVMVPLLGGHSFAEVHAAAAVIARAARAREPKLFSFEVRRARRKGRILLDVERNRLGAALMSPFSVRPESSLVSAPLAWSDLERPLYPEDFPFPGADNPAARFRTALGDYFDRRQSLRALLETARARPRRAPG
jgi:bifunctional non-homologous end joining protein LigD